MIPRVTSGLTYYLPKFSLCHRRDVQIEDKRWELWSPNSPRIAYFPGKMDPKFPQEVAKDPACRRFDGSLGRFEFTRFPQQFDPDRPWLAMVRRSPKDSDKFETVYDNWIFKPLFRRLGTIKKAYLERLRRRCIQLDKDILARSDIQNSAFPTIWKKRPLAPSVAEIAILGGEMEYEDAVDRTARIGRRMAEIVAWMEMADGLLQHSSLISRNDLRQQSNEVPPADEDFMGVWLNGADELWARWLLLVAKVPCFIIHIYVPRKDFPSPSFPDTVDRRCKDASTSFLEGTDIEDLNSLNNNKFQQHATRTRQKFVSSRVTNHGLDFGKEQLFEKFQELSSSWEQLNRIQDQPASSSIPGSQPDHSYMIFTNRPPNPSSKTPTHPRSYAFHQGGSNIFAQPDKHHPTKPLSDYQSASTHLVSIPRGPRGPHPQSSTMPPKHESSSSTSSSSLQPSQILNHQDLDLITVATDRFPWVRPPPIASVGDGSWSHWEYNDDNDEPCFIRLSKGPRNFEHKWFDRILRRILYLDEELEIAPGVLDVDKFGAPAPRVKYLTRQGRDGFLESRPSNWVYSSMHPQKSHRDEIAQEPKPEDLPSLTQTKSALPSLAQMMEDDDDDDYACSWGNRTVVKFPSTAETLSPAPAPTTAISQVSGHEVVLSPQPCSAPRVATPPDAVSLPPALVTAANERGAKWFRDSTLQNLTLYSAFDDRALWSDKEPFLSIRLPFWRFKKLQRHANETFSLLVAVDTTNVMEYDLPLSYAPIVAFLDIWYRSTIPLVFENIPKVREILHYLTGLRNAFENELSLSSREELTAGGWRSVVVQEWACRAYRSLGHSDTGRVMYHEALEKQGVKHAYREDVLKLGKCFIWIFSIKLSMILFRLDDTNHKNIPSDYEFGTLWQLASDCR